MKNIVVKKFIDNKLDRNISKKSLYGDVVEQIDVILEVADSNININEPTRQFMTTHCLKIKEDFLSLSKNKKFFHLEAFSIYKLTKLKNKISDFKVFEL